MIRYTNLKPVSVVRPEVEEVEVFYTNKFGDQARLVGEVGAIKSICELFEANGIFLCAEEGTYSEGWLLSEVDPS